MTDRIRLDNGQLELEFDGHRGQLRTLRHRGLGIDLITEPRRCENFRLLLPLERRRGHYIHGCEQPLAAARVSEDGRHATLEWCGLSSDEGRFDLVVRMHVRLDGAEVSFVTEVENHTDLVLEEVLSPAIGGLDGRDDHGDWRLHHTDVFGVGVEWPLYEEFPGSYLGPAKPVWWREYPTQMSMPWLDLYDSSRGVGVTVADLDPRPAGAFGMAFGQLCPCTVWRGQRQFWPTRQEAGDEPVALTLGWARFPFVRPRSRWSSPPTVVRFHEGTWWEAARWYREWFDRTMPFPVSKSGRWLPTEDAWQSTIISYPEGTINARFADLPKLAEAAKSAGVRVLQIDGWHTGGIDRNYPDYQPDPMLGTAEELRGAIARCRELGVRVLLFTNLQWANVETDWYRDELHRYAVTDPRGFTRNTLGWEYHTLLGLAGQCESRMVMMDPAHGAFAELISAQLQDAIALGPAGLQIDKLGVGFGIDYADGLPAGPDAAVLQGTWQVLEQLHHEVAKRPGELGLATEAHWDRAMPFVDASYSRFFSETHLPTTAVAFPEFKQTNCIVGHYDRAMVNNCVRYGHIINLEMDSLHGSASDAPNLAEYVRAVLSLRRGASAVLWNGRLVERSERVRQAELDEGLHLSTHQSVDGAAGAVVLNHFRPTTLRARISVDTSGSGDLIMLRPGASPERVRSTIDLTVPQDELVVLAWGQ